MPFKIVQTVEKGRCRLSVVPSIWEENGKLFWPSEKIKNRVRLVRDETSFPSPNWDILDCTVKRSNIQTYMAAEHEIRVMENQTDTDNETSAITTYFQSAPVVNNFEDMVQNLTHNESNVGPSSQANSQIVMNETMNLLPTLDCDQLIGNQNLLLQQIHNHDKILHDIIENMQKLNQKVAMLSVQINEAFATIIEKIDQPMSVTLLKDANPDDNQSFRLEQVGNKQQFEVLENTLKDKAERAKLQKQLSFFFQPCEGNGLTYAYKLLDSLISREFLCKCSWSGASRGNHSKIPLKDFKNFIIFFCGMIRSWDPTFTMGQTEQFFKIVLKNAVKRKAMKNLRCSTKRTRKTKSKSQDSTINKNEPKPSSSKVFNEQIDELENSEVYKSSAMDIQKGIEEESHDEDLC